MAMLESSGKLKKQLTLFHVYALATGATLSSGFFLLPGIAAAEAGSAVIFSYLLALAPLLPGILCKIELATAMPRAGGEYFFLDRSLGPLMGTIGGMGTWCSLVLKTAFALVGVGAYLKLFAFFPASAVLYLAMGLALVFGGLNLLGAKKSSMVQSVLVVFLLLLLVWFVIVGMGHVQPAHFEHFMDEGFGSLFSTAALVCISYMGVTKVASVAEEVKNPERNLPLGILLALVTAVIVYGVGTYVIVGVVDMRDLVGSVTPVADAADIMIGHRGAVVMTIAAILAFCSVGNGGILAASRYPLAMSRDKLLPIWLSHLTKRKTPSYAIYVTVVLILLFLVSFDLTMIAKLASGFLLLLFALNCLAVIVMRESAIESYDPGYRSPFYPWLHIVGLVGPLAFILLLGWLPILFCTVLIVAGSGWHFYYVRKKVTRGGAIYHLFARWGHRQHESLDRELRSILKEKGLRAHDPYDEVVARATVIHEDGPTDFEKIVLKASEQLAVHLPISAAELAASFMEGSRVGATPVSKGAALPHVRLIGLKHPLMVLVRTREGVHVEVASKFAEHAIDQPVYAVIFLVSPEEDAAQHLRILAQIAQHVDDGQFMIDWLAAEDEQQTKRILLRQERFLQVTLDKARPSGALIGQAVRDLNLPQDSLIAIIDRGDQVVYPQGDTTLAAGDSLTIVGQDAAIGKLKQRFGLP